MSDESLVRVWKDPAARDGSTSFHPSGEIRAARSGGLGRRAGLLAGLVGPGGEQAIDVLTVEYTTSVTIA
jgi:hypothetical protein